jgi:peptidoglycan/LPS O-acetylase OafA/YrhL
MEARLLRTAFLVGAVTDALALVPMLSPWAARLLWGFDDPTGSYRFAMGYGASLMLGWTALLVWAHRRPVERRGVAALTVLVIYALVITEVAAVVTGVLEARRMAPTWCLQAALLGLFASAYHYPTLSRWLPALAAREP